MKDKRKTLDKKEENLKFKKIVKKQRLQEQGITLIALVVTIIILLILSGVTLNIALSDNGLFSKTKKATEDYKEAQSDEEDVIRQIATQMYGEYVGAIVEGYEPASKEGEVTIKGTISGLTGKKDVYNKDIDNENIKDNGDQTFNAEEMNWRVWDFDGNTLRIIGNPTTTKLTLQGAAGYNNGVWVIDHICRELYSNEEKGAIATSLKRTDIQRVSTYDYTKYKHKPDDYKEDTSNGDSSSIYFGATKTYTNNHKYPAMWGENDREWTYEYKNGKSTGIDEECKKWEVIGDGKMDGEMNEGDASTEIKQSYYFHNYNKEEFINNENYNLIFDLTNDEDDIFYWLENRSTRLIENEKVKCCTFCLDRVHTGPENFDVVGADLCNSKRFNG